MDPNTNPMYVESPFEKIIDIVENKILNSNSKKIIRAEPNKTTEITHNFPKIKKNNNKSKNIPEISEKFDFDPDSGELKLVSTPVIVVNNVSSKFKKNTIYTDSEIEDFLKSVTFFGIDISMISMYSNNSRARTKNIYLYIAKHYRKLLDEAAFKSRTINKSNVNSIINKFDLDTVHSD